MMIRPILQIVLVASLMTLLPACAKKPNAASGGSSTPKDHENDEPDDDENIGKDSSTDSGTGTDSCLMDDCGTDDGDEMTPESEFFEEVFTPPAMKDCTTGGHVYLRCTNVCSTIKSPAKFKCDRSGIEAAFSTVQGAKANLADYIDNKHYFIDQCGVTAAGKPFVALSCYTKNDGVCVDKDEVDSKDVAVESHFLSSDPAVAGLCSTGAATDSTPN